jgi:hypothetical protein
LVQYALQTIVEKLGEKNEIIFLRFNGTAKWILNVVRLNPNGKHVGIEAMIGMRASGNIKIWDSFTVELSELKVFHGPDFIDSSLFCSQQKNRIRSRSLGVYQL